MRDQYLIEQDIVQLIILKGLCCEVVVLYPIHILARLTKETGAHTKNEEDPDAQLHCIIKYGNNILKTRVESNVSDIFAKISVE